MDCNINKNRILFVLSNIKFLSVIRKVLNNKIQDFVFPIFRYFLSDSIFLLTSLPVILLNF